MTDDLLAIRGRVHELVTRLLTEPNAESRTAVAQEVVALSPGERSTALAVAVDLVAWVHWRWSQSTGVPAVESWQQLLLDLAAREVADG